MNLWIYVRSTMYSGTIYYTGDMLILSRILQMMLPVERRVIVGLLSQISCILMRGNNPNNPL